jgi:hypothetical protein
MAGLVPPARPKPLRRGEGPAIHVFLARVTKDVDARLKAGHDDGMNLQISLIDVRGVPIEGTRPHASER